MSAREKVPLANRTGSCDVSQSKGFCCWNRRDTARRDDCTEETPTCTHAHAHATQRRQLHKHTHPSPPPKPGRVHGSPALPVPQPRSTDRRRWAPTPGEAAPSGPHHHGARGKCRPGGAGRQQGQETAQSSTGRPSPSPSSSLYNERGRTLERTAAGTEPTWHRAVCCHLPRRPWHPS